MWQWKQLILGCSWARLARHFQRFINKVCENDLLVYKHLTNRSQLIFLFTNSANLLVLNTWAIDRWLFLQHLWRFMRTVNFCRNTLTVWSSLVVDPCSKHLFLTYAAVKYHEQCIWPVWTTLKHIMHLCLLSSRTTHSSICCIWTYFICVCYHQNLSLHELNRERPLNERGRGLFIERTPLFILG